MDSKASLVQVSFDSARSHASNGYLLRAMMTVLPREGEWFNIRCTDGRLFQGIVNMVRWSAEPRGDGVDIEVVVILDGDYH